MINFYDFILSHLTEIARQTFEHIGLTLVALAIAIIIGLPLGILLTKYRKISNVVLGGVGIIQTIPSIALLGFLLPFLGIGTTPAIVALFLYALLPIVRNTFTGIKEVEPSVTEAAKGMGMSDMQILRKVELPLAVPVIFAGIRTATVINVGVATLCALIASGGLGQFIFRGIALNNMNMILAGAIPAAILALFFDFVLSILQKYIHQVIKPLLIFSSVIIFVIIPFLFIPSFFAHSFRAGFTAEFMERADGYPGLKQHYAISMNTVELDPGLMYQALRKKKVDVIGGFTTDGRIKAYQFQVLKDDKHYFPPYHVVPIIRGETLRKFPFLYDVFSKLEGKISNNIMSELNFKVDHNKEDPAQVAKDFLSNIGLKTSERKQGEADIVIGSKNFTEQYILAEIFRQLIENYSGLNVELKTGLAGTKICFDALVNGEIDLYPEYTGTGLLVILKADENVRKAILGDEEKVYAFVSKESELRFDIEWLQPLGFNNTYALMMREKHAGNLEIKTISDLKNYLDKLDR
ncbi:MAG: ABC transporter permease/substrate-binding protein [Candidatus Scalinduaceae bacterium]